MKAITLYQPWATLVVIGAKKYETRSWNTFHRGRILIHASKNREEGMNVWYMDPFRKYIHDFKSLPFGAIVGEVTIVGTHDSTDARTRQLSDPDSYYEELCFGNYNPGRRAWELTDPEEYSHPIPCKGAMSIWNFPDQLLENLKRPL